MMTSAASFTGLSGLSTNVVMPSPSSSGEYIIEWIVVASVHPFERITSEALPVKDPNRTLPLTSSANRLARKVLPVPA